MSADSLFFVDTNVLLYSLDSADPAKQQLARLWLDMLWECGGGRLSWQVLNEFYANAAGKIHAPAAIVRRAVETYIAWQPAEFSMGLIQSAWQWVDQAGVSYWDGLILASAARLGCNWLLSEDFQDGRKYGSVRVLNPFRTAPEKFFQQRLQ
jgi:predicted nucleic acid-binding protein